MKKVLKKWTDKRYVAENTIFEYENGIQHVHTTKTGIKDFVFEIIFLAGSFFEHEINLPQGTAHFLEHMLCNPNNRFKTEEAQDKFLYGNSKRPEIFTNASTWTRYMSFYGYGHYKGAVRMIEYVGEKMKYPIEKFEKYIENERGVILAELQRSPKESKDEGLAYNRFLYGRYYKGFSENIIGTKKDVKKIKVEDLVEFYETYFNSQNCVIVTQSPKELTAKQSKLISEIALGIKKAKKKTTYQVKKLKNEFRVENFKDEQSQDLFTSFNFFRKIDITKPEYPVFIPLYLARNLLSHLLFKRLRDDLGLTYGVNCFSTYAGFNHALEGFKLNYSFDSLQVIFDEIYKVFMVEADDFIMSKKGLSWLESEKSQYIYQRTNNYNGDYGQNIAFNILMNEKTYAREYDEMIEFVRNISQKNILKTIKQWRKTPPHVWFVSKYKSEKVLSAFEKTELYKYYKDERYK